METDIYDPFVPGFHVVGFHEFGVRDPDRDRRFPCDVWHPLRPGAAPLIVYSHSSGGNRRSARFLCRHLASHGYVVAAMDHSELVAPELARRERETATERAARIEAVIASRVPDIRVLLDRFLVDSVDTGLDGITLDRTQVGLVGHSFGGWTVLATTELEPRVRAVVAQAPGGSARPRPGILPLTLRFAWTRDVPVLYLAAEQDTPIPISGVVELFERTPGTKRLVVLRQADHQHFIDDVEGQHEAIRTSELSGDAAWIPAAMRPIRELCSGDQAHRFVRGLTLAHLDATLRGLPAARAWLTGDVEAELAKRGVAAFVYRGESRVDR